MKLDITSYASINGQLYKFFAVIGGVYCLLAIVTAGAMVWLTRRHLYFRWWLAGFIFHVCWLLSWLFIVQPVNNAVAKSSATSLHYLWSSLRMQWELGHVVGFIFHLLALSCLLVAVLKFNRPGAL